MKIHIVTYISVFLLTSALSASAQFNSGSTGVDGALDLSTMNCPANICEIQLPESGILNYSTISVPSGKTLQFKSNPRNTPVILLAQGNVTIGGDVKLNANGQLSGPGGFYGGPESFPGFGPGGGTASSVNGRWVGPLSLVPVVGGSGGAGGGIGGSQGVGGGGGGAIVIASSTSIIVTGFVYAQGQGNNGVQLGKGSGGAIRLVANTVNVSGGLNACIMLNISGNCGVVRLEATSLIFTGGSTPAATLAPINPIIIPSAQPQLTIQSIGGYAVPAYSGSRFDTVDLLLPNQIPDPVNVVVGANNIPVGTQVDVGFVRSSSGSTSTPCILSGTTASSTCTATISNLNRTGVTYLLATAIFTPPALIARFNPKGENHVAKIRLEMTLGAKQKYIFLNDRDKVVDYSKLKKEFLQYFGV